MKKLFVLSILFLLVACGAIGIGSNHETMVYNNSNDIITVSADSGVYKIKPEDNLLIYSNNDLTIKNLNSDCQEKKVLQKFLKDNTIDIKKEDAINVLKFVKNL